ncbi:TRNA:m(4)X modification enzyme like [Actinidia chinensis var. chinensis]|uniref:tRNA:m(4)X modification enzyme TRM13 n=1 Tax=Actinidia chinensis var. chinensis TaxID=1590841 RepID=A0A2R6QD54_ACTCC|nr:TRNA:m(4)X modification enzyme like [Actinidia chinensis var. chinensis]
MGVKDFKPLKNPSSGPLGSITSEMKRNAVYNMTATELSKLISKIQAVHSSICTDIQDSYKIPQACGVWINREVDGKLPFQEKHVLQQASILGNLEEFGVLKNSGEHISRDNYDSSVPAVIEFGAGRGYLTQMLADCYGIKKVFLVERKSYKLKADRSLRQKESLILERLRIDIEDLNLNAVESLQGIPYLAIGKHLCGPATDMTLRCCLGKKCPQGQVARVNTDSNLRGLAIATCCHHLCQWTHYINKSYLSNLGITKDIFHAITWFTSWAVDADHSSDLSGGVHGASDLQFIGLEDCGKDGCGVEDIFRDMRAVERALLGFMCKDIIDMGRLMWIKKNGPEAELVKYVPYKISPENHLLIAKGLC